MQNADCGYNALRSAFFVGPLRLFFYSDSAFRKFAL